MNPLTEARRRVADELRAALGERPVFDVVPSTLTPPCVMLGWGTGGRSYLNGSLRCELIAVCVAPAPDNTSAVEALEELLVPVTATLHAGWEEPGRVTLGGQTYLAATVRTLIDVQEA